MVLQLINKTKVIDEVWADILAFASIYGYEMSLKAIIEKHINKLNIDRAIEKTIEYLSMGSEFGYGYVGVNEKCMNRALKLLKEYKKVL